MACEKVRFGLQEKKNHIIVEKQNNQPHKSQMFQTRIFLFIYLFSSENGEAASQAYSAI